MRTAENRMSAISRVTNSLLDDLRRALSRFDSRLCGFGELRRFHGESNFEFAVAQNFQSAVVFNFFRKAICHYEAVVHNRTCRKLCKVGKV